MSLLYGAKSRCAGRESFLCISDDFSRIKFRSLNPESEILESEEWNDENSKREKEINPSPKQRDCRFLMHGSVFAIWPKIFLEHNICFRDKYSSRIIISQDKLVSPYITAHQLSSWAIGRRLKLGTLRFWAVVIISAVLSCRRSRVEYKANGNIESERFLL